jgi:hypothetical protein
MVVNNAQEKQRNSDYAISINAFTTQTIELSNAIQLFFNQKKTLASNLVYGYLMNI